MQLTISGDEFAMLRTYIEQECGIVVGDEKAYLIESRLARLVAENACETYGEFYLKLKNSADPSLKTKTIDAMTTNETLWFRDMSPYTTLKEHFLPQFAQGLAEGKKSQLRIWSAACSSGQEPYSIAMMTQDYARMNNQPRLLNGGVSILATDISSSVLMLAKMARYDELSMSRGMLPGFKERYFTQEGRVCVLKDEIKQMIQFQQMNLQNSFAGLGSFDLVFLRNVAIYFSPDFKKQLFEKIHQVLNPNGYLMLGSSESLTGFSQQFKLCEYGKNLFYQKV